MKFELILLRFELILLMSVSELRFNQETLLSRFQ